MPMIPEEERLAKLHDAYLWEQDRIAAWLDDLENHPEVLASHPDNEFKYEADKSNPMVARFYTTWKAYFNEVKESNQWVIDVCDEALVKGRKEPDPGKRKELLVDEIRKINRVEHRKGSVSAISNAVNMHRQQSKYFKSLDAVIDLENEVRDYIEAYLVDGKP